MIKKVWVTVHDNAVGDSLCMLPFLKYWADRDGFVEYGPLS